MKKLLEKKLEKREVEMSIKVMDGGKDEEEESAEEDKENLEGEANEGNEGYEEKHKQVAEMLKNLTDATV